MINKTLLTYQYIELLYEERQYPFNTGDEFANLFGIRSKDLLLDQFNDILGVAYVDEFGDEHCLVFDGTTKPGLHYLRGELGNPEGTFILAPGFYKDCWMPGIHKTYNALIQSGPGVFKGYRDNNSDGKLDASGTIYTDSTGVDLHTTRFDEEVTDVVDRFSAGCQVFWRHEDFTMVYNVAMRTFQSYSINKISYALFPEP